MGKAKKHDYDEGKEEADSITLQISKDFVSSVDYNSNQKEGLGDEIQQIEEHQIKNKRKKKFCLDNAEKLPKLELESMRSRNVKELDKQTTVTTNELFANQAKIIRLKLSTKNKLFDYVDKISIRKTNDRENKKYHKIKRLHKTSGGNEQKPN